MPVSQMHMDKVLKTLPAGAMLISATYTVRKIPGVHRTRDAVCMRVIYEYKNEEWAATISCHPGMRLKQLTSK